ncbi:hypothetical protein EON63_08490 [archaeon]|nr:MAG: hypothetical protein EON63_08490 [archaeon]
MGSIAEEGGVEMTQERREAEEMAAMEEARKVKARQTPTVTVPPYTQQVGDVRVRVWICACICVKW